MIKNTDNIILSVIIQVNVSNEYEESPIDKIKRYILKKKETQPVNTYNAGSVFKNNKEFSSWEIVDQLGYRGYINGNAKVSEKHANFIINNGYATFKDIYELIVKIKEEAKIKMNLDMECEWEIIE